MKIEGWTQAKIAALCDLHAKGYSFSHISAVIGMSRNACIGRAHRMGLRSNKPAPAALMKPTRGGQYFGWDDESIGAVRDMACRGMSDRKIADAIGLRYPDKPPITSGAISYIRRANGIASQNVCEKPKKRAPLPRPIAEFFKATPNKRGVKLLDLEPGMCRWPLGEGAAIRFCGEPSLRTRSYCKCHVLISCASEWLNSKQGAALRRELADV